MTLVDEMLDQLLKAPDSQFSKKSHYLVLNVINETDNHKKAGEILFLLDCIVCFSLGSDFVVVLVREMLNIFCKDNDIDVNVLMNSPHRKDPLEKLNEENL